LYFKGEILDDLVSISIYLLYFDFHFFFHKALLYFQTVDIFLLIPLCNAIIYIKSTNKIRFLQDYLCLFKYYRSRYSPKWQDCGTETRSI